MSDELKEKTPKAPSLITHHLSLLLLTLIVVLSFSLAAHAETPSPFAVEKLSAQKAPDFTLKDVNGKSVSLSSFRGKVVILNFWATWCPPCREEIPSLDELYKRLRNKGLVVLAVSLDPSASAVRNFLQKHPVGFFVFFDEKRNVTKALYKVFSLPTTFLIDKKGNIAQKYFGEQDFTGPEMTKQIESLLK
ncbi:MAG TPA: TlpA disulfide reductase family protein [Dissulfurispiraceae bacterium]